MSKTFESAISEKRGCILVTPFDVCTNLPSGVLSGRKPEIPMQAEISRLHSSVSGRCFARTRNGVPRSSFSRICDRVMDMLPRTRHKEDFSTLLVDRSNGFNSILEKCGVVAGDETTLGYKMRFDDTRQYQRFDVSLIFLGSPFPTNERNPWKTFVVVPSLLSLDFSWHPWIRPFR